MPDTYEVNSYQVLLKTKAPNNPQPFIRVKYEAEDEEWTLAIRFMEPADLPTETVSLDTDAKLALVKERASRYPWYVDLLRNEGPTFVVINEDPPLRVTLMTGREQPGEGDLDY